MAKIKIASEHGAVITNGGGERIVLPTEGNRTEDCIKCYVKKGGAYYWSSAYIQEDITVNGKPFDEWFMTLPLKIF